MRRNTHLPTLPIPTLPLLALLKLRIHFWQALPIFAILLSSFPLAQQPGDLDEIRAYLEISDRISTSGQITYDQIKAVGEAGFDVVINLAPADQERNGREGFLVVEQGMAYFQVPVSWREPSQRDLKLFFDLMNANRDRRVLVHCFANMRVSVFTYLYRTLQLGEPEKVAWKDVEKIWDPSTQEQWGEFIREAKSTWEGAK